MAIDRYDSRPTPHYYNRQSFSDYTDRQLNNLIGRLEKEKTSLNLQLAQVKATSGRLRARLKDATAKNKQFKSLYVAVNHLVVRLTADNELEIDSFDDVMNALYTLDNGNFDVGKVFKE